MTEKQQTYSTTTLNAVLVIQFKDNQGSWTVDQLRSLMRTRFNGYNNEFEITFMDGQTPVINIREK